MNFCVYLHMHSHGNIFVISASLLYHNVVSWYIWLFLWCSIREKNGVKRSVSLSPIYHPLAMTGYINMSFISDPREGIWSVSICIMNKVKEIIKEQTKPICWQTCCLDRLLLILWWKPPAPPPQQHLPWQHEANGRIVAGPRKGRKDAEALCIYKLWS